MVPSFCHLPSTLLSSLLAALQPHQPPFLFVDLPTGHLLFFLLSTTQMYLSFSLFLCRTDALRCDLLILCCLVVCCTRKVSLFPFACSKNAAISHLSLCFPFSWNCGNHDTGLSKSKKLVLSQRKKCKINLRVTLSVLTVTG